MKIHAKPIITLASAAILLCGLLCQTAQAQTIFLYNADTAVLAANNGVSADDLTVTYTVTEDESDSPALYTYSYVVFNPVADSSSLVTSFNVGFNSDTPGALLAGSESGNGADNAGDGVIWNPTVVSAGNSSPTMSFESYDPPVFGNVSENGLGSANPWASNPGGQQVPIPNTVPEPATTSLLALALLFLPLRSTLLKKS